MKKYKQILSLILLFAILLTSFTGCGSDNEAINIYTELQNLNNIEKFDFEISAKCYLKKTENVEIETPTIDPSEITPTSKPMEETTAPTESISNSTTSTTASTTEPTVNVDETTKTENITTETDYNLRLVGTYLGQNEWCVKIFAKDANTKGYTNITNIYKKDKDIYLDAYSIIDSLDFLLDANGAILSQFDFSKGNIIKTDEKTLLEAINSEKTNKNIKLTDTISAVSNNLTDIFNKLNCDISGLRIAFNEVLNIANETTKTLENKEENKDKENSVASIITTEEDGTYVFNLNSKEKESKEFIKNFGNSLNKDLYTRLEKIATEETTNEKEEKNINTTSLRNFINLKDKWLQDYGKQISAYDDKTKTEFKNTLKTSESDGLKTAVITTTYNHESTNKIQSINANIKINEVSTESIELPTKVSDATLEKLHNTTEKILPLYIAGNLENKESDITPEKMISTGKLIRPSQNDDFKYKVFDRYISISEYIGKSASVVIPDKIDNLPVFVLEESACEGNETITSVSMTDNIVQIGKNAFNSCTNLSSLKLSKNLENIPDNMCRDCTKLSNVIFNDKIKTIGPNAFNRCETITEVVIPPSVNEIGSGAFQNCESLKTIIIMDGTIYDEKGTYIKTVGLNIGSSAFSGHFAKTVIVPQTVISIDSSSFTPNAKSEIKTMYYGYTPSQLNTLCAEQKYLFTSISPGGEIDKALKSNMQTALNLAKSL